MVTNAYFCFPKDAMCVISVCQSALAFNPPGLIPKTCSAGVLNRVEQNEQVLRIHQSWVEGILGKRAWRPFILTWVVEWNFSASERDRT